MRRPSDSNTEGFDKKVTVQCTGCGNDLIRRIGHAIESENHWCEECWPDRKREIDRQSREKRMRDPKQKARRLKQARDRYRDRTK